MGCRGSKSSDFIHDSINPLETTAPATTTTNTTTTTTKDGNLTVAQARSRSFHHGEATVNKALKTQKQRTRALLGESIDIASMNIHHKVITKNVKECTFIEEALKNCFLFTALDDLELSKVVEAMDKETIEQGREIIKQGDTGDNFYLVQTGSFDVYVDAEKVFTYGVKGAFGELALIYDCPRAATVVATTKSVVWYLDRDTFRYTLASNASTCMTEGRKAVGRVPVLDGLSVEQLDKIAEAVQITRVKEGDRIIRKGDTGSVFYMIKSGSVNCTELGTYGKGKDVHLFEGDYFGERALLLDEPRAGTVTAMEDCVLMALDRNDFEVLLGSLKETLDHNLGIRVVKSVPILSKLTKEEQEMMVESFSIKEYSEGEYVIRQGDPGEEFFVVKQGLLKVTTTPEDSSSEIEVATLQAGDYFGEQALKDNSSRSANVIAQSDITVFCLLRNQFETLLGPLSHVLERVISERKKEVKDAVRKMATNIKLEDLQQLSTLGTGTFGRVKLVKHSVTGKTYALKKLQKAQIVAFKQQKNVMNEKLILKASVHPFILQLIATYKDNQHLYMLLELVQGGELFSLLYNMGGTIPNNKAMFYAACVLDALSFLHSKDILYRDLKPENLLIDNHGYIKVVDFGFAKVVKNKTFTLCGTPEYLAPELVLGKGHNKGVDYWALGILIFEMLCGYSPFADHDYGDQITICKNIINGKIDFPKKVTGKAKDIIRKLLTNNPTVRLGCQRAGAEGIKNHAWFGDINWNDLYDMKLEAPWIPPIKGELDTSNFDEYDEEEEVEQYTDDGTGWDDTF